MKAGDEAGTPRAQTGGGRPGHAAGWHGRWRFLRHSLEMVAAMLVGMVVLGAALRGVLALAGLHYPTRYAELVALEMAGAMFAPAVALVPLLWLGVIAGDALLVLEHLAMLPLMFLVILRRRAEYGGSSHG
jgi:hypothetical protein